MAINKDLNIDPYYENFYDPENPQYKQYNKILFRPARAVQARELTQLQTILQEQIERFGSNVYQEGTIISGINPNQREDIFYVKIKDTARLADPAQYNPSTVFNAVTDQEETTEYFLEGQTTGLRAKIVLGVNGFQTRDPDLKTFFINYLSTSQNDLQEDIKEYQPGEVLKVVDVDGVEQTEAVVAEVENHAGRSFGASVDKGILYQKGHFVFAEQQLIIIEKYDSTPRDIAIGFDIQETIVTSNEDQTLLDNAQGYNNVNAPGADRLKLEPILAAYEAGSEPDNFFTLIRYERGEPVAIRDVTQFNSIAKEMARRTYEESGDYVVRGMELSLDQDADGTYAVVSPGKAYIKGYGVELTGKKWLNIASNSTSDYITRTNMGTGANYGQFYEFNWEAPVPVGDGSHTGTAINTFLLDGTRYDMYDLGGQVIGSCSIRSITNGPSVNGTTEGRLYVYAIEKNVGFETSDVYKIGDTIITSELREVNSAKMIFPTGATAMRSVSDLKYVERVREVVGTASNTFVIEATVNGQPINPNNIFVINSVNELVLPSSVTQSAGTYGTNYEVTLGTLGDGTPSFVYYDRLVSNVSADTLQELDVYVRSTYTGDRANLGIPNGVELLQVIDDDGNGEDVTSRFKIVTNAKDAYYDLSYIQLKRGQSLRSASGASSLQIKFKALRRTSTIGNGYLTVDSYANVDKKSIKYHRSVDGTVVNPLNTIDFRPYHNAVVEYALGAGNAQSVPSTIVKSFPAMDKVLATNTTILATHDVYLPRIDAVVVDSRGQFEIVKGSPSEKPSVPKLNNVFQLGEVYVPGGELDLTGSNPVKITQKVVKNYTMKDITKFDTQIKRLTEQVALNALEKSASEMFIPDASGASRFKNGFLIDTFESLAVSDVTDPDFKMAIDPTYKIGQPALKTFPIDLKLRSSSSNNITDFSKITMLGETGVYQTLIQQQFATSTRNCVSNFYNFRGNVILTPDFVSDYDTVRDPDVNINIDLATPMIDLLENIQEFYPMTRTDPVGEEYVVDTQTAPNRVDGRWVVSGVNETWRQDYETLSLAYDTSESTKESVGDFVTDISFKPFMKSREVKILISGLRPNTRHYFFFADGVDINSHVTPGVAVYRTDENGNNVLNASDVYTASGSAGTTTSAGQAVRTDANGVLAAVFTIPEGTFYVGENTLEVTDVPAYNDIESAGTSYGAATYRAYRMGINRAALDVTTRSADFKIDTEKAPSQDNTRFRETSRRRRRNGDPIAQTFFVRQGMAGDAKSVFIKELDLYFQRKDATAGITVEIREVQNGYPSATVLPFGRKYLTSDQVVVSDNGNSVTTVSFDNPIKLDVEREYAFVVMPDANSPEYLIWTSKVGETDKSDEAGVPVTSDWGDGVLFTSTNNRAWKSYQDEDIKFAIKRLDFSAQDGYVDLVPNNHEFLSIENCVGGFVDGEYAYVKKSSAGQYVISNVVPETGGRQVQINSATSFAQHDYVVLEKGSELYVTRIEEAPLEVGGLTTLTLETPVPFDTTAQGNINITFAVAGEVTYFNGGKPDELHIKESSARDIYRIIGDGSEIVRGSRSGAYATITNVDDIPVSFFQPIIHRFNTTNTGTTMELLQGSNVDKSISQNDNVYLMGNARFIPSRSNVVDTGQAVEEDFVIRVHMTNNGATAVSPIIDDDLSILNAYQYAITDQETTTSAYVSKPASLSDRMYAEGLKVLVGAYRPTGTMIDVYARFVLPTNVESFTDWVQLDTANLTTFSATHNVRDYREFEYNLDEDAFNQEYSAFQIKIVMRHMTDDELELYSQSDLNPDINLFTHISDYRAIAVT